MGNCIATNHEPETIEEETTTKETLSTEAVPKPEDVPEYSPHIEPNYFTATEEVKNDSFVDLSHDELP